jgi:hypothetical protein
VTKHVIRARLLAWVGAATAAVALATTAATPASASTVVQPVSTTNAGTKQLPLVKTVILRPISLQERIKRATSPRALLLGPRCFAYDGNGEMVFFLPGDSITAQGSDGKAHNLLCGMDGNWIPY